MLFRSKYNIITVGGIIDISSSSIEWAMAKDDVTPQDIFRLSKGSPEDKAIVAKYCIQDCALCNKLIAKLQILTNNIGMANVCSVPLSFLFLRGQGIKIFSLVAKKCRDKEHLIQTHKVKPKPEETKNVDIIAKQAEFIEKTLNNRHQNYEDDEDDNEYLFGDIEDDLDEQEVISFLNEYYLMYLH